jgi:hypothetical protein
MLPSPPLLYKACRQSYSEHKDSQVSQHFFMHNKGN